MNNKLYDEIVESNREKTVVTEEKETVTWLVFKCGEDNYAIDSNEVSEILRNNEIFQMPFVPRYIRGVLNSYGNPYAVIDFSLFLGKQQDDAKLFMLLKNRNSLSLQISEIQEFHTDSEVTFQKLSNHEDSDFFSGAISFDGITAPVLNIQNILEKIRTDIENN